MPILNISRIPNKAWAAIPRDIQNFLAATDLRGRVKAGLKGDIRSGALARLDAGETVDTHAVAEDETKRLLNGRVLSTTEDDWAVTYITEQLAGKIAQQRDGHGVRRYFCIGERQYIARDLAPVTAWAAEARRMLRKERKAFGAVYALVRAMADRFDVPEDLQRELDRMEETRTYAEGDAA